MRVPLQIAPGIVSDDTDYLAKGAWVDGSNVRFRAGQPQVIGGWSEVTASTLTGVCRNALAWRDYNTQINIAFGTHSNLHVFVDNTLYDITPASFVAGNVDATDGLGYGSGPYGAGAYGGGALSETFPRTWSLATWGENLLAAPRAKSLYVWTNSTGAAATKISQAPSNMLAMLVTPQRQVLALGCQEEVSGSFNTMCIRGCDFEDYTDWTTASDNNAFEYILEGGGKIITGELFGSYVAVWTDTSVFLGQLTGNTIAPYRFDLVASNCGLIAPNAVVVINQTAYWLTPDYQFYAWQLGGTPQPVRCPILKEFKDNIDDVQVEKVCASAVSAFNEIWWFYPDSRDDDENTRYVAINLLDGVWFRGALPRTAAIDSGPQRYPVFCTVDGDIYYHENGDDANGSALSWSLESGDVYLDEGGNRLFVRGIWPDFEAQTGDITLTIYLKDYPQSTPAAKGPWTLAAGRAKRDFRADGRLAAITLSGSAAGTFMRLGKPSFDVVASGQR